MCLTETNKLLHILLVPDYLYSYWMGLSIFIQNLFESGAVQINESLDSFISDDLNETQKILEQFYQEDIIEMPGAAPDFSAEPALWASNYFYRAVQLTVLRDANEEIVKEQLNAFTGELNPSIIYSADLVLRYLPALFELAKGLAPADMLVQELKRVAVQWPFSSVGIELNEPVNYDIVLSHPSLKQAYIDRIIERKDNKRITDPAIKTYIKESTGQYIRTIWPEIETIEK